MKNGRRKFAGEEKMAILRRHLVEKMPVSDVWARSSNLGDMAVSLGGASLVPARHVFHVPFRPSSPGRGASRSSPRREPRGPVVVDTTAPIGAAQRGPAEVIVSPPRGLC